MINSLFCFKNFCLTGLIFAIISVITGCATQASGPIANPAFQSPDLAQVRNTPDSFMNQPARWGGLITRVQNQRSTTDIEIVEQPLNDSGRPRNSDTSNGRFIARFNEFLDPAIYAVGKPITVVGIIKTAEQGSIGEHPYAFPVLATSQHRLWPKPQSTRIIYYRDPFLDFPYRFYPHRYRYPKPDRPKK